MRAERYAGLVLAALLALPSIPATASEAPGSQAPGSPTTEHPMPDPCERAPNLPFCK